MPCHVYIATYTMILVGIHVATLGKICIGRKSSAFLDALYNDMRPQNLLLLLPERLRQI